MGKTSLCLDAWLSAAGPPEVSSWGTPHTRRAAFFSGSPLTSTDLYAQPRGVEITLMPGWVRTPAPEQHVQVPLIDVLAGK